MIIEDVRFVYMNEVDDKLASELTKHAHPSGGHFKEWLKYDRDFLVAMIVFYENKIIGWAGCRFNTPTVSDIGVFVDKPYRRHGIGTIALNSLLFRLNNNRMTKTICFDDTSVMVKVMEQNIRSFGFEPRAE